MGNNKLDAENCISLPTGCIHAVFTTYGGFVCRIRYTIAQDLLLLSKAISLQPGVDKWHYLIKLRYWVIAKGHRYAAIENP